MNNNPGNGTIRSSTRNRVPTNRDINRQPRDRVPLSSLNENSKATSMALMIKVGQPIRVRTTEGIQYYVKTGNNEFVNAKTGHVVSSIDLYRITVGNKRWKIVNSREFIDKLNASGMLDSRTKRIEYDMEVNMKTYDRANPRLRDIAELGWVEINNRTGGIESKTRVLMHHLISKNIKIVNEGNIEKLKVDIGTSRKDQEEFIRKFSEANGVSEGVATSYYNFLRYLKQKVADGGADADIIRQLKEGGVLSFKTAPGETTVMATVDSIGPYMNSVAKEWIEKKMGVYSANPGGVDQSFLNVILKDYARSGRIPINLGDSLGINRMLYAMMLSGNGVEFYGANIGLIHNMLNRLGIAGTVRNEIIDEIYKGASSKYSVGTSVEAFAHMRNFIEGNSKYVKEVHSTIPDVIDEAKNLTGNRRVLDAISKDLFDMRNSAMGGGGVSYKLMNKIAYLRQVIYEKIKDTPFGRQFSTQEEWNEFFESKTGIQRAKAAIDRMMLKSAENAMNHTLLKDAREQFGTGEGTFAAFMLGAIGGGLVSWAVNKARARYLLDKRSEPEGLSHNSILTIIRRLQLTDFGSPRLGNSAGGFSTGWVLIKSVFDEARQAGLGKSISNLLSGINAYIKEGLFKQSAKELTDKKEIIKESAIDIWSRLNKLANKYELSKGVLDKIKGTVKAASDVYRKIKGGLNKYLNNEISLGEIGRSLVKKASNVSNSTKMIVGGGLAIGIGGSILLDSAKGSYDPYYDYHHYVDEQYHRDIYDSRGTRTLRALRQAINTQDTVLGYSESGMRIRQRRRHSDFGGSIRPLISGMRTEKLTMNWGNLRKSLEVAFKSMRKATRVFHNEGVVHNVVPESGNKVNLSKLKRAVNRVAKFVNKTERVSEEKSIMDLVDEYIPKQRKVFKRLVKPASETIYTDSIIGKGISKYKYDMTSSNLIVKGQKAGIRNGNIEVGFRERKFVGNYAPENVAGKIGPKVNDKVSVALRGEPLKQDSGINVTTAVRRPKHAQDVIYHSDSLSKYYARNKNVSLTDVSLNVDEAERTMSTYSNATKDVASPINVFPNNDVKSFISKGDLANLSALEHKTVYTSAPWGMVGSANRRITPGITANVMKNKAINNVNMLTIDFNSTFRKPRYGSSLMPYAWDLPDGSIESLF